MPRLSPRRRLIVDLPEDISQRALAIVGNEAHYRTLSDLVATALENQMTLETGGSPEGLDIPAPEQFHPTSGKLSALLPFPGDWVPVLPFPQARAGEASLSSFTNRLTPLIVPVRCIALFEADNGRPPSWDQLMEAAGLVARKVGLAIRREDERQGRRGSKRRWTAWPVGAEELQSVSRFRRHFVGRTGSGQNEPPILALGLVAMTSDGIRLTEHGYAFGRSATPMLEEAKFASLLSIEQQAILRDRLNLIPGEARRIAVVREALRSGPVAAVDIDVALARHEPNWSESQVVSQRAALLGRMTDAGFILSDSDAGTFFERHIHDSDNVATS